MVFQKLGANKFKGPTGKPMTMKQIKVVYSGRRAIDKVTPKAKSK